MNFIYKIFNNVVDETVHKQFSRFGKGTYEGRALVFLTKGKNSFKVKTSFEFANDFIFIIASKIHGQFDVSGKIVASYDFLSSLSFEPASYAKRGSFYTAEISRSLSSFELLSLYDKFKLHFLFLQIKGEGVQFRSKASLPKPGGSLKAGFCSATLPSSLLSFFAFDFSFSKKAEISHTYVITELVVLTSLDSVHAREAAQRKGKILRNVVADGTTNTKETELLV